MVREISQKKQAFRAKLEHLLDTYSSALVCEVDMVGSKQMQTVRQKLRGKAVLLMGKNTIIRKVLREYKEKNPKVDKLMNLMYGNVGIVFTNNDLSEVRKIILDIKVPAPARVNAIAPSDCFVPAGPTGLDPGQTSFFQALNIATKIVKGTIEIINQVHLIKVGDKINPSMVSLLSKLDIKPFFFGVKVLQVYEDGSVYEAKVLDLKEEDLLKKFMTGVQKLAAISLKIGVPNAATVPHSVARGFKNLIAISLATEITFKQAQAFKDFLANPCAFTNAVGYSSGSGGATEKKEEKKVEKKEEKPESDGDMGFSLFD